MCTNSIFFSISTPIIFELIKDIESKSVDLILIDPPYLISRDSNFNKYSDETSKELITKYGSISIDFGDWDKSEIDWDILFSEYHRVLKDGGTLIIFYGVWKSTELKLMADKYKFKQPRVCQWQKTNPVPINSKLNYLSNAIEYFFTFVKGKKPTFNSVYDNGVYRHPICHGKERYSHPTQKPLQLISDIISKILKETLQVNISSADDLVSKLISDIEIGKILIKRTFNIGLFKLDNSVR